MSHNPLREPTYIKIVISEDVYAKLDEFKKAWKGTEVVDVSVRVQMPGGKAKEVSLTMSEFLEALGLEEADEAIKPCQTCDGTGEVSKMGPVYAGEPHMADVDTEPCPDCRPPREPEDRDE